jgi:hypothetical protein
MPLFVGLLFPSFAACFAILMARRWGRNAGRSYGYDFKPAWNVGRVAVLSIIGFVSGYAIQIAPLLLFLRSEWIFQALLAPLPFL